MAKGVGLIGNFKGKVGNTVGYSLKDSNNKQTQGIRVYQPVVRNPKTYAQAEQRMKLAPINATYRALKMIVDRGQEGLAYGNKSRLAWLSQTIKAYGNAYFEKSALINVPVLAPLTKGSLVNLPQPSESDEAACLTINLGGQAAPTTIGALSSLIVAQYPNVKNGDQITFVNIGSNADGLAGNFDSITIDTTSTDSIPSMFSFDGNKLYFAGIAEVGMAAAVILSREGENSAHLRSTTSLTKVGEYSNARDTDAAKEAAIVSYMSQGANTDWAEESLIQ